MSRTDLPTTVAPPLRADAARNRRRLLDAARAAFAEDGLAAPISSIATRAGVAKGTFFRHFATKELLITALIEDRLSQLTSIAEQVNAEQQPGWEALSTLVERISAKLAADKSVMQSVVRQDEHQPMIARGFQTLEAEMTVCLERAQAVGEVRADVTSTDLQMLLMGVAGATAHLHGDHPNLGRRYRRIILDGLRTPDPSDLGAPPITQQELVAARHARHAEAHGPGGPSGPGACGPPRSGPPEPRD